MNQLGARAWFDEYLAAFAACGRGESDDLAPLLRFYGVPLVLSTDAAAVALTSDEQVLDALGAQIVTLQAAGYDRSETLASDHVAINATSALLSAEFSRRRADGAEIGRFRATYLIIDGPDGRRICALAVHSP